MDSSLSGLGKSAEGLSSRDTQKAMEHIKAQLAIAQVQELLQKMSEKCFKKCITKPGSSLDNSEQKCIAMCMDRYMDVWNLVSKTYSQRLAKENI